jgi:hypothetical protein
LWLLSKTVISRATLWFCFISVRPVGEPSRAPGATENQIGGEPSRTPGVKEGEQALA